MTDDVDDVAASIGDDANTGAEEVPCNQSLGVR